MSSLGEMISNTVTEAANALQETPENEEGALAAASLSSSSDFLEDIRRTIIETGGLPEVSERPESTEPGLAAERAEEIAERTLHCCLPCTTAEEPENVDNCCGQVAIGTVLNHFGNSYTEQDLQAMNPAGIFTSPTAMTEFLNERVGAQQHNNGSIADIKAELDAGNPVVVLINNGGEPHWITLTGYETDCDGELSGFQVRDQAMSFNGESRISREDFLEAWSSPLVGAGSFLDGATNYSNLWISTGTESNVFTRQPFDTAAEDLAASGVNRLVRGWNNASFMDVYRGINELTMSLPAVLLSTAGNYISSAGDSMVSWGTDMWNEGGLSSIVGGASWLLGQTTRGIGAVTDFAGDCLGTAGRYLSAGIETIGNGVSTVCSTVSSGFSSACSWVGSWF